MAGNPEIMASAVHIYYYNNNGFANSSENLDFGFKADSFETVKNDDFQSKLDFQPNTSFS